MKPDNLENLENSVPTKTLSELLQEGALGKGGIAQLVSEALTENPSPQLAGLNYDLPQNTSS